MGRYVPQKESGEVQLFSVSDMVHSLEFGHVSLRGKFKENKACF